MDGHLEGMTKLSNRDRILTEGLRVVHAHGYAGASVRDIVHAAGVPQGARVQHVHAGDCLQDGRVALATHGCLHLRG